MNTKKVMAILVATSFLTIPLAQAGPPVTITFKNMGNQDAAYTVTSTNEAQTQAHLSSPAQDWVKPQQSDNYIFDNPAFPDISSAALRYTMGRKTCTFSTSYVNRIVPGGLFTGTVNKAPKWNKKAIGLNGAICTAHIVSTHSGNHSWSVLFTMK